MIEAFGKHPEGERLDAGNSLISRCAVAEYAGKVLDLGNPATVVFEFEFDSEAEAHGRTLTRSASRYPTSALQRKVRQVVRDHVETLRSGPARLART